MARCNCSPMCPVCCNGPCDCTCTDAEKAAHHSKRVGMTMTLEQDIRHLIYLDTQFDMRGETDLQQQEMQSLEARGWIAEGEENGEYVITEEGERVIAAHLTQPAQSVDVLPFDDDVQAILGRMCFQCIYLAAALRAMGHTIDKRAKAEQAAVLHWLLNHYLKHGKGWSDAASAELEAGRAAALQEKGNG